MFTGQPASSSCLPGEKGRTLCPAGRRPASASSVSSEQTSAAPVCFSSTGRAEIWSLWLWVTRIWVSSPGERASRRRFSVMYRAFLPASTRMRARPPT